MRRLLLSTGLVLAAAVGAAGAIQFDFEAETLEGQDLGVSGVAVTLDSGSGAFALRIDTLTAGRGTTFRDIEILCARGRLDLDNLGLVCDDARVSLDHPLVKLRQTRASLRWQANVGGGIELHDAPLFGDSLSLQAHPEAGRWRIEASAPAVDAAELGALLPGPGFMLAGDLRLEALVIVGEDAVQIQLEASPRALDFQDADARYLGQGLEGALSLEIRNDGGHWLGSLEGRLNKGEMLFPAAYVQPEAAHPLMLSATLAAPGDLSSLEVRDYRLGQQPWVQLSGSGEIGLAAAAPVVRRLEAILKPLPLDAAYQRYLAPLFVHPLAGALELAGEVGGRLRLENGRLAKASLSAKGVSAAAETENTRLALEDLDAGLELGRGGRGSGHIDWRGAQLFDFDIGAAHLPFRFHDNGLALLQRTVIPLFDGSLQIGALTYDWSATPGRLTLDAVLTPVSMERVSRALGWIPMQGQLSGVIPSVTLSGGELAVDGALLMQVFDGNVVIRHLRVSDLFGYWPILEADAQCRDLDLELLTGTYEFGRITGRIDGDVAGLRLENWRPTAFDARFASSEVDDSSRKISQKAVGSIVSLSGSGMPAVLSRGFLRFFDEFRYARLGIACRLRNGVCEMDGVEPAEKGYYLVKGGGIPRIDVIGFNRSTDWEVLVDRLIAVTKAGPPVIE